MPLLSKISIDRSSQMNLVVASRFRDIKEIHINSLFVLTIFLSLSGINFEYSFKLSILTLMNTVNSSAYGLSDFEFQNLHFITKYFLILFMIIGRIELLTILLLLKKFLFKN